AEDGIRDRTVTGVQTCALPISREPREVLGFVTCRKIGAPHPRRTPPRKCHLNCWRFQSRAERNAVSSWRRSLGNSAVHVMREPRSEERRVGKEWRCRWWPDQVE